MKAMKVADIRKMAVEEVRVKLSDAREEMMKLRFQQVTGQLTDSSRLTILRKDIARMETRISQLRNQAQAGAAAKAA